MLTHIVFSLLATDKFSIGFITNTLKHFEPIDRAGEMDGEGKNWVVSGPFNTTPHIDKVHAKEEKHSFASHEWKNTTIQPPHTPC